MRFFEELCLVSKPAHLLLPSFVFALGCSKSDTPQANADAGGVPQCRNQISTGVICAEENSFASAADGAGDQAVKLEKSKTLATWL